jgi:hypothetical protein
MTREDLAKLLEHFATCAISVSMVTEWTVDQKHEMIMDSIDTVADTVIFCTDRTRITNPSTN